MKYPKSCRQCRESKRKCTRRHPGAACDACQQRHLKCSGQMRPRHPVNPPLLPQVASREEKQSHSHPRGFSGEESIPQLSHGMAVELVDHYLRAIHDKSHSLFHPPTLRSQVESGLLGNALLYAICAIGSKFSANPDARALGPFLSARSKQLLQADLENICLENIQICILVAMTSAGNCNRGTEALFMRIAQSMADIMSLDSPMQGDSNIMRECKQRTWWSLFLADRWCIFGLGLPSQMRNPPATLMLPMEESTFHGLTQNNDILYGPRKTGFWALKLALAQYFTPIFELNRLAAKNNTPVTEQDSEVEALAQKLKNWEDSLPENAQMTLENLHRQQEKGLGGVLLALHLMYQHFSILLFFRFLEDQQTTSRISRDYATRCKSHATAFHAILRRSRQLKECEVVFPVVGHMVTVSSAVSLHTLLFGDVKESQIARKELEENYEALIELKQYWPAVSKMMERLTRFQNICLLSMDSRPHQLDGWMVRFLVERAISLTDRELPSAQAMAMTNLESEVTSSRAREFSQQGRLMKF